MVEQLPRYVITLCIVILQLSSLAADESVAPFVAAVDRFAAHREIDEVAAGRLLVSELSCTACHQTHSELLKPRRGPRLNGAGRRLNADWMRAFILSPHSMKRGTAMPALLDALPPQARDSAADALVAFLNSQQEPFPVLKAGGASPVPAEFWRLGDRSRGSQLFHRIGCVACHEPDAKLEPAGATKPGALDKVLDQLTPEELEELGLSGAARRVSSVQFGALEQKYSRRSLTMFLHDPHRARPDGRMPRFQLSVVQAADLAEWLLDRGSRSPVDEVLAVDSSAELVAEGRRLFQSLGCANCHTVSEELTALKAPPLADLSANSSGCLQSPEQRTALDLPDFHLSKDQLRYVLAALNTSDTPDARGSLQHTLLKFNCLACHERESSGRQLGGVGRYRRPWFETFGHVDLGDEGRLPPPLTQVGRKLRADWLTRVLQGKAQIRPHMRAQMPLFPSAQINKLPQLLVQEDRSEAVPAEDSVFAAGGDTEAGRLLLDTGCVQCHPIRGEALPGVMGTDLSGVASRVTPDWFHDFLLNPAAMKPRTRMPTFFPNGKSQNPDLLVGDTERQISAIWNYLKDSSQPLPPKIEQARSATYELVPKDRPILLRTFMQEAGTHAIAVGFPAGVHVAFDAEQVRPAFLWRGRFLDARGTWFERFTPPAVPLGKAGIALPAGPSVAILADRDQAWPAGAVGGQSGGARTIQFKGYRLDNDGVPTFLYRVESLTIEERLEPVSNGIRRQIRTSGTLTDGTAWLRVLTGSRLKSLPAMNGRIVISDGSGLTVIVPEHAKSVVRSSDGTGECIIPVTAGQLEVIYSW